MIMCQLLSVVRLALLIWCAYIYTLFCFRSGVCERDMDTAKRSGTCIQVGGQLGPLTLVE